MLVKVASAVSRGLAKSSGFKSDVELDCICIRSSSFPPIEARGLKVQKPSPFPHARPPLGFHYLTALLHSLYLKLFLVFTVLFIDAFLSK